MEQPHYQVLESPASARKALTMWTTTARMLALAAIAVMCSLMRTHAQADTPRLALQVTGLTAEERDALNRDLTARGDMRIAFACVPAGILILEQTTTARPAEQARALAVAVLNERIPAQRRMEAPMSLEEAETRCNAARNR